MMGDATGTRAHSFELSDLEGAVCGLDEFAGSWLLLVFHRHLG